MLPVWALPVSGACTQQHSNEPLHKGGTCPSPQPLQQEAEQGTVPQRDDTAATLPQHASEVDVRTSQVGGTTVAIVGSGMTAAQLAMQAVAKGAAQVLLISRHDLKDQPFSYPVMPPPCCMSH